MKSSISWLLAILAVASAIALSGVSADAATKKKEQPPESPYEMPMRIVVVRNNVPGCEPLCPQWLSAEGQITARTPALFKKALADTRAFRLPVVITSTGGDVDAALAIGEMIRKRHLDVVVGWTYFAGCSPLEKKCKLPKGQTGVYRGIAMSSQAFCVSACSFVLAAGERRLRGEGSFVGVHQISRTVTREKVRYYERYRIVNGKRKVLSRQIVSRKPMKSYVSTKLDKRLAKKLDSFFNRMGIDKSLLAMFNRAPPTSMYMMAGDELRSTRLITGAAPAVDLVASTPCANTPPAGNCVLLEANAKP
jgi:hypothetical protein